MKLITCMIGAAITTFLWVWISVDILHIEEIYPTGWETGGLFFGLYALYRVMWHEGDHDNSA